MFLYIQSQEQVVFQGVLIHLKSRLNDGVLAMTEQWSEVKMLKGESASVYGDLQIVLVLETGLGDTTYTT